MKPIPLLHTADYKDLPYINLKMWLPAVSPTFISWYQTEPFYFLFYFDYLKRVIG